MSIRFSYKTLMTAALFVLSISAANAHTTSIGYLPGDNAGEMVIWTGSYHSPCESAPQEGVLTMTGVEGTVYGPEAKPFDITPTCTKPEGLVDSVNNCYWPQDRNLPLDCTISSDPGIGGGVVTWQGVMFTGLAPGKYEITCGDNCGTSAFWDTWPLGDDTPTIIEVTGEDIGGGGATFVPVPTLSLTSILLLVSLILLTTLVARRHF
jgi:hypothetical protein